MSGLGLDHVQVAIPAGGEAIARAFYGDLLGLAELEKPAALAARGGCWFSLGDRQLHLGIDPDFRPATKAHVAMVSETLTGLRTRLEDAGVTTRDDAPIEGRARFLADDPFGNRLEFLQHEVA
jgi:catechol 2,3-dioxygenase-like lactoylglutathione lyase family enzyme